jgi:hypothetical protein
MLNKFNNDLDTYDWFCKLTFTVNDIFHHSCKCNCKICEGNENSYDSDLDESIGISNYELNDLKTKCSCYRQCSISRLSFLHKFINLNSSIVAEKDRLQLINCIEEFKSNNSILYHPNSNSVLLDVIHPSLDCYISGVTKIINNKKVDENIIFQWLPLNVKLIDDYHKFQKKYKSNDEEILYTRVNDVFNKMVPMFNKTVLSLNYNNVVDDIIIINDCQVIVKIQELHLTPEKPKYDGSSWHLEGTKYEKIIATGIYYYDFENIKDNNLQFRTTLDDEQEYCLSYPQNCTKYVDFHYGLGTSTNGYSYHERSTFIPLGSINTKEGLSIVFPNIMQHKVSEIELIDKTKPGYRKIMVFFLIDPRESILSVDDVKQPELSDEDKLDYETILMFQRKNESILQSNMFEREINLCEH